MEQETEVAEGAEALTEGVAHAADATTHAADAAHGADAAVGACVDHGSAVGMPQLCFDWFPNQIFWLVVTLVVIFFVLSRVALPRIAAILAERAGTITNDIAAAEELKQKAAAAEAAYEKALADARAEANRIVAETRAGIQADLDAELAKADEQIAAKAAESEKAIAEIRDQAASTVSEVARDTARAIVAALGIGADDKAVDEAVDARIKG